MGGTIERTLENAVTDIVTQSIINLLQDMTADKLSNFARQGISTFSSEEKSLDKEVLLIINECIELIKAHVSQQRWKSELDNIDTSTSEQTGTDETSSAEVKIWLF